MAEQVLLHKEIIIKFLKQHEVDIDLLLNCNKQEILMNVRLEKIT